MRLLTAELNTNVRDGDGVTGEGPDSSSSGWMTRYEECAHKERPSEQDKECGVMEGRCSRALNGKAPAPRSAMADGKVGPFLAVVANGDALAQRNAIPRGAGSSGSSVGEQQQQQLAVVSATREVSSRAGEEAVLECSLLGPPDMDVDWWRSGRLVQPALLGCRMRSDGRKARLVFPAAHEEDSGFYTCRLSTAKEEQTCSIRLVVRPSLLPIFTRKPESLDVADGRPARLDCRVSGTPAPAVTWFRDGRPVQSGERRRVSSEKGLHCLSVPHASAEDEGEYTVTAANTHGEVSCSCTLIVSEPRAPHASNISKRDMMPSIAEEPELGEAERDGDVESHRDGPRDSATARGHSARRLAPPRSGKVAARDARSAGVPRPSTPSGPLLRDPKAAPDFSQPLCDVAVQEGSCAVLECRGQARIPPQVSWLRQGEPVPLGGRVTSKEENGTFRLIIQSAKLADAGVYKCILSNSAGRAFCHAHLHVVDATPGPPDGPPIVTDVTADSVTLSWKPPKAFQAFSEPGSVTYALQYQVVGRSQWIVVASNVPGTSHAVRTLRPGLHYLFRALTVSPHGCSRPSPASAPTCLLPHEPFLNEPPRFVKKYEEIFAVENEPLEITCRLNHVQATVSWTRNGIPVDESSGEVRLSSRPGGTWALEMPRARAKLLGELVCTARGEFGSDSYTAVVSQAEAPHFEVIMEDVEVQEGDSVRLSVVVHGRPEPDVLWYKDGARLAEAGGLASVTRSGSACSLLLRDVRGSDRGLYACEARSRAGTARCMAELSVRMEKSEARQREMPEQEVRKLKDHYEILEEIGRGAFGSVRRVRALSGGGSPCAAKSLPRGRARREAAERELRVAARLAHERVVCLHDAFRSRRRVIIVMELCSNEELLDRLVKKPALSEHQVKMYIKQILEAISYLHSINILHLDIEPSNILMADTGKDDIKISDFGFAQEVVPGSPQYSEFGTPEFVSPEVARHSPVYKASDIWPVGVITYVCLSGLSPFLGENDRATLLNVTRKTLNFDERTAAITSREAQDFISRVLVQDIGIASMELLHKRRPLADDCLKHPWFKSFTTLRGVTNISTDRLKFFLSRRRLQRSLVRYKSAVVLRSIPEMLSGHVAPRVSRRTAKQLRDATASSSFSSSSSSSSGEEDPGGSESSNGLGLDALRPAFSARSQDDSRGSSARETLGSDTEPAVLGRLGAVAQRNGECGSKEAAMEWGLQSFSERRAAQRGVIQRTNSADAAFQDGRASASQYLKPHLSKSASLELPPRSRSPGLMLQDPPSESSTESRGPLELVKDRPSTFLAESPLVAPRRSFVREVHQRSSSDPAGSTRLERGASSSEDIASGRKPEVFRSSGSIPVGREPALTRQLAFEQRGQSSATPTALDAMLRNQQGGSALDEDPRKTTVVATDNERCLWQQKAEPTITQSSQSSVAQNGRGRQLQTAAATRLPQFTGKTPEPGGLVVPKPQATEARTSQAADNGAPWVTRTTGGGEVESTNTNPLLNRSKPQTVGRYAHLLNAASTDGSVREMAKRFSNNGSTTRPQLAPRDEGLGQRPGNVRAGSLSAPKQSVSQTKAELLVAEAPVTQVLYRQLQQSSPDGSMLSNAASREGDRSISDTAMASKEQLMRTREPAEEPGSLVKRLSQRFKRSPSTERKSTEGTESRESEGRSKTPTMMQKFSSRLKRIGSTEKIESEHKLGEAPATEGQQAARDRDEGRDVAAAAEGSDGPMGRTSSPAMALRRRIEATVSGLSLRSGRSRSEDRAGGGDAQTARRRAFGETRAGSLDAATDDADEPTGPGRAASEWTPLRRTGSEGASLRELSGDEGMRTLSRGVKPPPSPSSSSMRSVTSASTDTEEPERRSRWDRWGASRLNRRDRSLSPHQDSGSSSRDSLASVSRENPAPAARLSGFKESVRRSLRSSESLPAFTVKLKDELLVEGEPVTLCCSPAGSPAPTISWLKDRKLLEPDERVRLAGSADGRQLLTIVRAGMADAGVYECMAVNSLGIATTSCTLARAEPPSWTGAAPEVPQVFESGALVVWKPMQARTPLTYCLEMQAGPGEPWQEVASGLSDTYHHVGGLCQGLAYRFRVACATRVGKGRGSPASEPALIPGGRALGVTARSRRDTAGPPATVATTQGHPQAPYTFLEEKARGRFGVIRVCRENATGRAFAAKVLAAADEESRALARAEFDALRSLSHEHVLAVHEAFVTPRHVVLVTELVGGNELLQHLCERVAYSEEDLVLLLRQLARALEHVHGRGLLHLDVCPANVVVSPTRILKLIDFGSTRKVAALGTGGNSGSSGTLEYSAPEVIKGGPFSTPADIWGLGVITFIVLSGGHPFLAPNVEQTCANIRRAEVNFGSCYSKVSRNAVLFLKNILLLNPVSRPTSPECLAAPWLQDDPVSRSRRSSLLFPSRALRTFIRAEEERRRRVATRQNVGPTAAQAQGHRKELQNQDQDL